MLFTTCPNSMRMTDVACWPFFTVSGLGRARQLCPGTSDLDFLGDLNRIVDLDAKISNRAFDLCMTQQ
jgi:hypothetical protein